VTAGVPTTFIQQLVHLSPVQRRAGVLGEVHKSYVMVPDVDRLLNELTMHGGVVPGEEQDEGDGLMVMGDAAKVGVKREGGAKRE
jgi:DNA-directed RNA polymerase III subunit RPC4